MFRTVWELIIWEKSPAGRSLIEVTQMYICILHQLVKYEVSHFSLDAAHRACGYP